MAIYRLLQNSPMGPEQISRLSEAYEQTLKALSLKDRNEPRTLIRSLTPVDCRDLIDEGVIDKGMIPKVEAAIRSLEEGVGKVHIIDGRVRHSLLMEVFTKSGIGTEIVLPGRNAGPAPEGRATVAVRT